MKWSQKFPGAEADVIACWLRSDRQLKLKQRSDLVLKLGIDHALKLRGDHGLKLRLKRQCYVLKLG